MVERDVKYIMKLGVWGGGAPKKTAGKVTIWGPHCSKTTVTASYTGGDSRRVPRTSGHKPGGVGVQSIRETGIRLQIPMEVTVNFISLDESRRENSRLYYRGCS